MGKVEIKLVPGASASSIDISTLAKLYPASERMDVKRKYGPAGWHPNPYTFLTDGARAVRAFCRPWPHKVVGKPKLVAFDIKKAYFKLVVTVRSEDKLNVAAIDEENPATEVYIPLIHYATDCLLPAELSSRKRTKSESIEPKQLLDITPPESNVTSETASVMTSFDENLHTGPKITLAKELVDVDVTVSSGHWEVEGQLLKWWYEVPAEGEAEREYVIEVRRQGGALNVSGCRPSWLEELCPLACSIM